MAILEILASDSGAQETVQTNTFMESSRTRRRVELFNSESCFLSGEGMKLEDNEVVDSYQVDL